MSASRLQANVASSAHELARLFEHVDMSAFSGAEELPGCAADAFAGLTDFLRDFSDCADCMTEMQKLEAFRDAQQYLDVLENAGFSVVYSRRDENFVGRNWPDNTPCPMKLVYVEVYPKGKEPKWLVADRRVRIG